LEEFDIRFTKDVSTIFDKDDSDEQKQESNLLENFSKKVFGNTVEKKAVLGMDILKYSEYKEHQQNLMPFVFNIIFEKAIKDIEKTEKFFCFNKEEIRDDFIPTGDGGFFLFDSPLHALVFNLHFFAVLHHFNTGHFYPKLSKYVGEFVIRSAITLEKVFKYEKNHFGKAIIDNARMLHKDKLNRFIISNNVYEHFMKYFNGIESILIKSTEDISYAYEQRKNTRLNPHSKSYFFMEAIKSNIIRSIHVQKMERTMSKNTEITFFNLEVQFQISVFNDDNDEEAIPYIITVGNLNADNLD